MGWRRVSVSLTLAAIMIVAAGMFIVITTSEKVEAADVDNPTIQVIDTWGDVGRFCSIALDSQDHVHVSFYDNTNDALRYGNNSGGPWDTWTIDSIGNVGSYSSIALDSQDDVHISYYDSTNGDLKYALITGGVWNDQILDGTDYVGIGTSIAISPLDQVHISYFDYTNEDLKYATDAGGPWMEWTIDSAGTVGGDSSVAVDSQDHVHISYWDDTNDDLKYASNSGGTWSIQTIDGAGDGGRFSSIAVDSQDNIHISYYDYADHDLKYATNRGGTWSIQTVDDGGDVGILTSIAVDSQDRVHICYYDNDNADLKYATNSGSSWNSWTIDSVGNIGSESSIAVDSQDRVHICYYDYSNGDLKYATFSPDGATPPEPPTGLTAIPGNGQVHLNWNAPTDDGGEHVTGYKAYWGLEQNGAFTAIAVTGTSYLHTGLENGKTYYYKIAAVNQVGEGLAGDTVSATPVSSSPLPSAPLNLGATVKNLTIELTWDAPSSIGDSVITGYKVYRGTSSNGMNNIATVTGTSYLDNGAEEGVKYYYSVAAVNGNGVGQSAGPIEAMIANSSATTDPSGLPFEYIVAGGLAIAVIAAVVAIFLFRKRGSVP